MRLGNEAALRENYAPAKDRGNASVVPHYGVVLVLVSAA